MRRAQAQSAVGSKDRCRKIALILERSKGRGKFYLLGGLERHFVLINDFHGVSRLGFQPIPAVLFVERQRNFFCHEQRFKSVDKLMDPVRRTVRKEVFSWVELGENVNKPLGAVSIGSQNEKHPVQEIVRIRSEKISLRY